MKQLLQNLGNGDTTLEKVPIPKVNRGSLLIETRKTLVSIGTEKMLVDFGKSSLLSKARQQPDKVKQVIDKVKTDGLSTTIKAVRSKLDQPIPLGYCNVGIVKEVGASVNGFKIGDRVLSNGAHAEFVNIPQNLCCRIPKSVSDEAATFAVVASIGLQGIRLINPTLGEKVVVIGLGLIGLLTVQLLRANGCDVLGADFDTKKCELAEAYGAQAVDLSKGGDILSAAEQFTAGRGVDAVLITASTKSNDPVHQAATMCRKRGRIVLVGVTGLELQRSDFYEKELSFQVSCSYGPGRYDNNYEQKGLDYPFGLVRWTEQRNFEAILGLMDSGALDPLKLVTHKYLFDAALDAYQELESGKALGIILEYPEVLEANTEQRVVPLDSSRKTSESKVVVGLLGAGNFTGQTLLPAFRNSGARFKTIVSGSGVSGTHHGKKFKFENSATDEAIVYEDADINTVFITTRHSSHFKQVISVLSVRKNVFVEKPLCLTLEELEQIREEYEQADETMPLLMVGFNRRFAPLSVKMKELLSTVSAPKSIVYTVNAGAIPSDHWTQDRESGGGRLLGEACHFIDYCRFMIGSPIIAATVSGLGGSSGALGDVFSVQLSFEDGSIGTVHYFANGSKAYPKERCEVFADGKILQMDNFRQLNGFGWKNFKQLKNKAQDKGHTAEIQAVVDAITHGKKAPIAWSEIYEVTKYSIELSAQLYQ